MLCPACQVDLHMTERNGVEIDYCPKCRGVWLDRGELDKIIERAAEREAAAAPPPASAPQAPPMQPRYGDDRYRSDDRYREDKYYEKRKKRGFLGELFD